MNFAQEIESDLRLKTYMDHLKFKQNFGFSKQQVGVLEKSAVDSWIIRVVPGTSALVSVKREFVILQIKFCHTTKLQQKENVTFLVEFLPSDGRRRDTEGMARRSGSSRACGCLFGLYKWT